MNIIKIIAIICIVCLILGLPVVLLWNYTMPIIFGLPLITFWQAVRLNLLASLLFKSTTSSK